MKGYKLLHYGAIALAEVSANGLRIDTEKLDKSLRSIAVEIETLKKDLQADDVWKQWRKRFPDKVNINSREQLGVVLYEVMGLKSDATTASGKYSTDIEALAKVDHPFVKQYVRLAGLNKMSATYLRGIEREVVNGFLHPFFNLHTTSTYRSSSQGPNFQNLPVRDPEKGKRIREVFIPRDGCRLVNLDYSGIEVKIAACYHHDPTMMTYLKDPTKDMHRDMAADCYMIRPDQVSKKARYAAKNQFVFPQFYGSYYPDCAKAMWRSLDSLDLKLEGTEIKLKDHLAKKGIKSSGKCDHDPKRTPTPGTFEHHIQGIEKHFWKKRFPVYAEWKRSWFNEYTRKGYFDTLTGFRIRGAMRRNEVINYPVQGSAFHCLLWSLIELQRLLKYNGMKSLIVGQVHDSIVADVPDKELRKFLKLAKHVMTERLLKAYTWINVPIDTEAEVTPVNGDWNTSAPYKLDF